MRKQTTFRDIKNLSVYLDKQLSKSERARLEKRLAEQPEMQDILMELRQARTLLQKAPQQRLPRNFTLTPEMVGMRPPVPRSVPVFRLASLTAAILLFISFTFNYLAPFASSPNLAAAPQYFQGGGVGGGCGFDDPADCVEAPMEAVPYGIGGGAPEATTPEELAAMSSLVEEPGTPTPEVTIETSQRSMIEPAQTEEAISPDQPAFDKQPSEKSQTQEQPFIYPYQTGLVFLAIIFGVFAFIIRQINIQRWRKQL